MANGLFQDDDTRRRIPPVQEAVQVLSLRLPQVLGGRALAPAELLAERPGGGADALVSSVVESVIRSVLGGRSALGGAGGAAAGAPSASFLPVAQAARVLGGQAPPITRGVGTAPVALDRGGTEQTAIEAAVANLAARLRGGRARPSFVPGFLPGELPDRASEILMDVARRQGHLVEPPDITPGGVAETARKMVGSGTFSGLPDVLSNIAALRNSMREGGASEVPGAFRGLLGSLEQEFSEPILARGTRAF